jgi:SNF2 family DNA or RNA helicase
MLDLMEPCLLDQGFKFERMDGKMSNRNRVAALQRFISNPEIPVLLLSLKCGGVGLNITAANHGFMMEPWWNYPLEEQAFGRLHRIGQKKPVFLHRLVCILSSYRTLGFIITGYQGLNRRKHVADAEAKIRIIRSFVE